MAEPHTCDTAVDGGTERAVIQTRFTVVYSTRQVWRCSVCGNVTLREETSRREVPR